MIQTYGEIARKKRHKKKKCSSCGEKIKETARFYQYDINLLCGNCNARKLGIREKEILNADL
jgi:formylmethanofuran dehydrogenase subunit E